MGVKEQKKEGSVGLGQYLKRIKNILWGKADSYQYHQIHRSGLGKSN
jgi:hypothetical protein